MLNLKSQLSSLCVFLLAVLCVSESAWGQMFGSRTVGRPLGNTSARLGTAAGQGNAIGAANLVDGSERFLRENRSRNDFVGSDRRDTAGFVGSQQALGAGRVRAATEGLQIETTDASRINRPLPAQPTKGIYYPRLEIGFELAPMQEYLNRSFREERGVLNRTNERLRRIANSNIELDIVADVAILRGQVDSQRTRELIETIAGFEPGIRAVRNELIVVQD